MKRRRKQLAKKGKLKKAGHRPKCVLPLKIQLACGDCRAILFTLFKKYLHKVRVNPDGYQHNIQVKVCVL